MRTALVPLVFLAAAACGELYTDPSNLPPDAALPPDASRVCGASNCNGCCRNNVCLASQAGACGIGGVQCVSCGFDTFCGGGGQCVPSPWAVADSGYDCRVPQAVTVAPGAPFVAVVDLTVDGRQRSSCGGNSAPTLAQRAFHLASATPGVVDIEAAPVTRQGRQLGVGTYRFCNAGSAQPMDTYACVGSPSFDEPARLAMGSELLRQMSFSIYDQYPAGTGQVRVSVQVHEATCADPAPLRLTTIQGLRAGAVDQAAGSCGGEGGADSVFRLKTEVAGNLTIRAVGSATLYLRAACDQGEVACSTRTGALLVPNLPAGTWYVWVDDVADAGDYSLSASLEPVPLGDSCGAPRPLIFSAAPDGGSVASDTVDLKMHVRNGDVSCQTYPGADIVYELESDGGVDLTVVSNTASAYSLRAGTCAAAESVCRPVNFSAPPAVFYEGALPAGRHLLSVAAINSHFVPLTLSAALTPSLPTDNCNFPGALGFSYGADGGSVEITGDTRGLHDDVVASCRSSFRQNDQVYAFTTSAVFDLRAQVTGGGGLMLRSSCREGELGCGYAQLSSGSLLPGTYHLWVDTQGPYTLTANLTRPALGDTCLDPFPLLLSADDGGVTLGVSTGGNTYPLFRDFTGSCGGSSSADQVFRFETPTALNLQATVSPLWSSYQPAVYLRSASCDGGLEVACATAPSPGNAATLSAANLPAGTWYLVVDGLGGSSGPFTLSIIAQ